ncbi:1-deoxy-D-xylulose-5-phosphate synthase [Pseudobutyrivibrio sp. YE44]|uniref:1-deoxy-D-xylulose-5-phosphate synthase n=1 Tax=Pseudobutyrivibrio sp. YE44 TaxID=1520802 RepID=UPI00088B4814|nr:1-deoxy-D-xylulose-5-phosphate synthase [Pseudobutyrivibrio sp. YE44]SDB03945.1 1-deoxy-D-xylulose-5-phosphate synthase [Pseudobutyrivibrio sp. YE44]
MYKLINRINGPEDVKKFSPQELEELAVEIREALFNRLTHVGGHFGPNFGMVEAEIAMHYVFNSPIDKFVFDVSHQSYPHKILTGRKEGYIYDDRFAEDSGYTNPDESEHDFFNVGHTSTSISLASGLAKARDMKGDKENIIAVIGDGSLSGGEALEALNVAGSELNSNFIILVNDNEMAIAETHGGIYKNLKELRETAGAAQSNLFRAFGLDYIYVESGNDIQTMINTFEKVKDIDHPIVIHIHTIKGLGYKLAEENKEAWHWTMPFDRDTGKPTVNFGDGETYTGLTASYIMDKAKRDKDLLVISPAMPGSVGLTPEMRRELGSQYIDVGIAEEQAVAMASGAAKNGVKPLVVTNMTFIQRTYDQISQDVCINGTAVTILLNYTSFAGLTDVTHLGIFGISAFSNIPNLQVLAPTSKSEYLNMLEWSLDQQDHPVMILIPGNEVTDRLADKDYGNINTFKIERKGENVAILALGDFYQMGESLADSIKAELGFSPTLINPRFASGLDIEMLENLKKDHQVVLTLEDGILDGGFGHKVSAFYGTSDMKVKNYGLKKEFYDRYNPSELLESLGMTNEAIIADVRTLMS